MKVTPSATLQETCTLHGFCCHWHSAWGPLGCFARHSSALALSLSVTSEILSPRLGGQGAALPCFVGRSGNVRWMLSVPGLQGSGVW